MGQHLSSETIEEFEVNQMSKPCLDEQICSSGKECIDFKILKSKYNEDGVIYLERMLKVISKIEKNKEIKPMYRIMIVDDTQEGKPRDVTYIPMKMTFSQLVWFLEGLKFAI